MKRIISSLIRSFLLISILALSSCQSQPVTAPTCEKLIACYQSAGYHVFHCDTTYEEEWNCYVKIWAEDESDYVFFYFFGSAEDARAYDDEREYNILLYAFSIIYGDPSWLHTKTYGNIEYEYVNGDLIRPFKTLINQ